VTEPQHWPRVPWSLVHPGDHVYAADRHVWEVTGRNGKLVTISRDGTSMSRVNPDGDVPCMRGQEWKAIVAAVEALRGAGFTVEHLGTHPIPDVDAPVTSG
jgi:hypothetical protein